MYQNNIQKLIQLSCASISFYDIVPCSLPNLCRLVFPVCPAEFQLQNKDWINLNLWLVLYPVAYIIHFYIRLYHYAQLSLCHSLVRLVIRFIKMQAYLLLVNRFGITQSVEYSFCWDDRPRYKHAHGKMLLPPGPCNYIHFFSSLLPSLLIIVFVYRVLSCNNITINTE